jgi:3-hydroxybutyryl-CoA dehydrogenase/5-formyl-3-hydroxy-2-methylpyridine 4-carboxylate dehydrogenase
MVERLKIAIVGLGSMGPGIAARLARGGHCVNAYDISKVARERAASLQPMIVTAFEGLDIADESGKLVFANDLEEAVSGVDVVIENIPENIQIKADFYAELEPLIGKKTIIASDTSGIPITKLQAHVSHPERFVGMHWSNPPHIVPMIEVIAGEQTALMTVKAIQTLIRDMNLLPVTLKKDVPGFVENRVLYALLRECVDLVERGVIEPEDLDTCVNWGIGFKLAIVGPMRLLDMAGLDIYQSVSSFLNEELCGRSDVSPLISETAAKGRLGMKSGGGLFDYTDEQLAQLPRERGAMLVALRNLLEGKN